MTPISTTRYDHAVSAKTDLGDIVIATREMLVDVTYTDGRPRKGALLIFFNSSSGRYLWQFGLVPQRKKTSTMTRHYGTTVLVHAAGDRLVLFGFTGSLVIHESLGKANGIEDAEAKALAEATSRLPAKLTGRTDDRVIINLGKLLPLRFFAAERSPIVGPMKILDISHNNGGWELILQGQWKEKITLDNKYQFTGHTRIN